MEKKYKGKYKVNKKAIIFIITIIIVVFTGLLGYGYNSVKRWDNLIYSGAKVDGIDLSGKTREQAKEILKQNHENLVLSKKINIKVQDKTYSLEYSKLSPKYDIDGTVNEVFSYGKNLSLFSKYILVNGSKTKNFDLKFDYEKKPVNELIASIEKDINKEVVDASINISGGISVTPDIKGAKLQKEALEKELFSKINGKVGEDTNVEAVVNVQTAKVTTEMLSSINAKISNFSTNFGTISAAARANNIVVATRSINGKVLLPGETFSYNDTVGIRTAARGYMEAPVIVNNKVESGLGGGICQVSTTLYNAVLRGNLKVTERAHHSLPSHYVPLGMDATVDYGNLDFKFTNSYSYPLYIQGTTVGGVVNFSIYSNSSLTSTTVTVVNDVVSNTQPTISYINDATILEGTKVVEQPSSVGHKVNVYRKIYKDGAFVNQETISNDTYKTINGVIRVGTKKPDPIVQTLTSTPIQ